jgi:hypothetical protein
MSGDRLLHLKFYVLTFTCILVSIHLVILYTDCEKTNVYIYRTEVQYAVYVFVILGLPAEDYNK